MGEEASKGESKGERKEESASVRCVPEQADNASASQAEGACARTAADRARVPASPPRQFGRAGGAGRELEHLRVPAHLRVRASPSPHISESAYLRVRRSSVRVSLSLRPKPLQARSPPGWARQSSLWFWQPLEASLAADPSRGMKFNECKPERRNGGSRPRKRGSLSGGKSGGPAGGLLGASLTAANPSHTRFG